MGFYDAFFGSDQSLYTAYSIIAAIIAICLTILLTATDVPIGNRILIVLFVIITLIPSIFLTLFELTCIVTGGTEPNRWWCHAFAWILAAFIIIYCIIVIIVSLISLFNYNNAIHSVNNEEQKYKISNKDSDDYAKEIIEADEAHTKQLEKFKNNERFYSGPIEIPDINAMVEESKKFANISPNYTEEEYKNKKETFDGKISLPSLDNYFKKEGYEDYTKDKKQPQLVENKIPMTGNTDQEQIPMIKKPEENQISMIKDPINNTTQQTSNITPNTGLASSVPSMASFTNLNEGFDDGSIIDGLYAAWK
jgi:hypothetical protein